MFLIVTFGFTPLHCACEFDSIDFLNIFFSLSEISSNISLEKSWAPLHIAAFNNSIASVRALLNKKDIDININGKNGATPLHIASENKDLTIFNLLLENGANPNSLDDDFSTPLFNAIQSNNIDAAQKLIAAGSDPRHTNKDKLTPLHFACKFGIFEVVEFLLKDENTNVDIDAVDKDDSTPLHFAVAKKDVRIVQLLLNNGADPLAKNAFGNSTFSLANTEIAMILRKAVTNMNLFGNRKTQPNKQQNAKLQEDNHEEEEEGINQEEENINTNFIAYGEEEEEEEEAFEEGEAEFLQFKKEIEGKVIDMQTSVSEQMKGLVKIIIDIKNEISKAKQRKNKEIASK